MPIAELVEDLTVIEKANPEAFERIAASITAAATECRAKGGGNIPANILTASEAVQAGVAAGLGITVGELQMCASMGNDPIAFSRHQRAKKAAAR